MAMTVRPSISASSCSWIAASTSGIERRGRLVEDQDRRILEDHAGERDALALPARQLDAALADMRVEAARPCQSSSPSMNSIACACAARPTISAFARVAAGRSGYCRGSSGAAAKYPASPCRSGARRLSWVSPAMSCPSIRMRPARAGKSPATGGPASTSRRPSGRPGRPARRARHRGRARAARPARCGRNRSAPPRSGPRRA